MLSLLACARSSADETARDDSRVLVVVLDGVAFEVARAVFEEQGAPAPALLLSSFPATTHPAMSGALELAGDALPPGYESRYFDWASRRTTGGGLLSYSRRAFAWRDRIDWLGPGVWGNAVGAMRPRRDSMRRIDRALKAFERSQENPYWVHIGSTDRLGHLSGPEAGAEVLRYLLTSLRRVALRRPFSTIVFSDHGMGGGEVLHNVLPELRESLAAMGLKPRQRLRRPDDVAVAPFGLVSSFELYTEPPAALRAARAAAAVEGVELCAVAVGADRWRLVSDGGDAVLERSPDGDLLYRLEGGDPLGYQRRTISQEKAAGTSADAELVGRWLSPRRWLELSQSQQLPDAPVRLAGSFGRVGNPASVVCSNRPGFMFGARRTERASALTVGRLRWTHGGLRWGSSAGFLWSDCPGAIPAAGVDRIDGGPQRALAVCSAQTSQLRRAPAAHDHARGE